MENFVNHFGKFFWLWDAFGIYLIITGVIWLVLIGVLSEKKTKGKDTKKKDMSDDLDDEV